MFGLRLQFALLRGDKVLHQLTALVETAALRVDLGVSMPVAAHAGEMTLIKLDLSEHLSGGMPKGARPMRSARCKE